MLFTVMCYLTMVLQTLSDGDILCYQVNYISNIILLIKTRLI